MKNVFKKNETWKLLILGTETGTGRETETETETETITGTRTRTETVTETFQLVCLCQGYLPCSVINGASEYFEQFGESSIYICSELNSPDISSIQNIQATPSFNNFTPNTRKEGRKKRREREVRKGKRRGKREKRRRIQEGKRKGVRTK